MRFSCDWTGAGERGGGSAWGEITVQGTGPSVSFAAAGNGYWLLKDADQGGLDQVNGYAKNFAGKVFKK